MQKVRLLLDANLSPETAIFLRKEGFDVKSLIEEGICGIEDEKVVHIAKKEWKMSIWYLGVFCNHDRARIFVRS